MILTIDSSSLVATVAIVDENVVIAEYTVNLKKTHSQTLLCMVDEIFKMTNLDKKSIKAIAVTNGPGSFTGLRIGAATAKGLALALDVPVIGVSTIETMAYNYNHCNKIICPIMDARRNQVYTGLFKCENESLETIVEPCAIAIEELISKIMKMGEEVVFLGDGVQVFDKFIDDNLTIKHYYAKQQLNRQRAATLGSIAWEKFSNKEVETGDTFAPQYLRLSQAERERMENDKNNGK